MLNLLKCVFRSLVQLSICYLFVHTIQYFILEIQLSLRFWLPLKIKKFSKLMTYNLQRGHINSGNVINDTCIYDDFSQSLLACSDCGINVFSTFWNCFKKRLRNEKIETLTKQSLKRHVVKRNANKNLDDQLLYIKIEYY